MTRPTRHSLMRALGRLSWLIALSLVLLVAFSRCGSDKKQDDGDDKDGTDTATGTPTGEVPAAWDGKADWSDSAFEVVEE